MPATILHIETSTRACSVSVARDGVLIAYREQNTGEYTHAEALHAFIDSLLGQEAIAYTQLSAVAVSSGPGSYTGLRIGTSAAKGLCYALDVPLISVSTLEAMASEFIEKKPGEDALFLPMIDARRMEVFTMGLDSRGNRVFPVRAEVVTPDSFPESSAYNTVYYFGDGADKCAELLPNSRFHLLPGKFASARFMAGLAFHSFQKKEFVNTAYFEPFYLKEFVAGKAKKLL